MPHIKKFSKIIADKHPKHAQYNGRKAIPNDIQSSY